MTSDDESDADFIDRLISLAIALNFAVGNAANTKFFGWLSTRGRVVCGIIVRVCWTAFLGGGDKTLRTYTDRAV